MLCNFSQQGDGWVCVTCGREWLGDVAPVLECSGVAGAPPVVVPLSVENPKPKPKPQKKGCGCGRKISQDTRQLMENRKSPTKQHE